MLNYEIYIMVIGYSLFLLFTIKYFKTIEVMRCQWAENIKGAIYTSVRCTTPSIPLIGWTLSQ